MEATPEAEVDAAPKSWPSTAKRTVFPARAARSAVLTSLAESVRLCPAEPATSPTESDVGMAPDVNALTQTFAFLITVAMSAHARPSALIQLSPALALQCEYP
jgi:hypothetical protein